MTIMRSIGNHHAHIRAWCWAQTGRSGKASAQLPDSSHPIIHLSSNLTIALLAPYTVLLTNGRGMTTVTVHKHSCNVD